MKKANTRILLLILTCLVLTTTFMACSEDDTSNPTPPNNNQEQPNNPNKPDNKDEKPEEEEEEKCDTNYNITSIVFPINRNAGLSETITIYPDDNNVFTERVHNVMYDHARPYMMPILQNYI